MCSRKHTTSYYYCYYDKSLSRSLSYLLAIEMSKYTTNTCIFHIYTYEYIAQGTAIEEMNENKHYRINVMYNGNLR